MKNLIGAVTFYCRYLEGIPLSMVKDRLRFEFSLNPDLEVEVFGKKIPLTEDINVVSLVVDYGLDEKDARRLLGILRRLRMKDIRRQTTRLVLDGPDGKPKDWRWLIKNRCNPLELISKLDLIYEGISDGR